MKKLCMFPGQGSQYVGMGEQLFQRYPHLTRAASEVLGYDIAEKCLNATPLTLSQTDITQPLLYVVSTLSYLSHVEETGIVPDYLAGHSLGEYAALFAAGSFDFITGLELVKERGRLMAAENGGNMYAVLGISAQDVVSALADGGITQLTVANYNGYSQTVIAGYDDDYKRLQNACEAAGAASVIPLKVSACFHTQHMRKIAEKFKDFLSRYRLSTPKIPVIANLTAHPYQPDDDMKNILCQQIYSPVLWLQTMEYLLPIVNEQWVEVGPGDVLSKIARQTFGQLTSVAAEEI